MGNKANKLERGHMYGKKKNASNKKTEISPYREGLTGFTQSPLVKFIKSSGQFNQMEASSNENIENCNI